MLHPSLLENKQIQVFLNGKSQYSLSLLNHFISEYSKVANITLHPTKTMIGIANTNKRIAWVTQIGKNFIHVVFPFKKDYTNNLCFQKIVEVPGKSQQYNHHFRILFLEDVNEEVKAFMKLAFNEEK